MPLTSYQLDELNKAVLEHIKALTERRAEDQRRIERLRDIMNTLASDLPEDDQ